MSRIYDSSHLTKRRAEKAIAATFLANPSSPNTMPRPGIGMYDSSVMVAVKTGNMPEITRFPTCITISPGYQDVTQYTSSSTPVIPGTVGPLIFTVGSIIVSWTAPSIGTGPFTYRVTPYLNGVAQTELAVTTTNTTYRFDNLQEWQPYTFTVSATNSAGTGPALPSSSYFLAPPAELSSIMSGTAAATVAPESSLKYIMNAGINSMLKYAADSNWGPTIGSRNIYIWTTSVVGAWNWVQTDSRISGTIDEWNWNTKAVTALSNNDALIWICAVINHITPFFINGYTSIYNCPAATIDRVKRAGEWNKWEPLWKVWYDNRQLDGSAEAATAQPTTSANWNNTIDVATATTDISTFPQPRQWTPLTVQGNKQKYLTYNWGTVKSSCLTNTDELNILNDPNNRPLSERGKSDELDTFIINNTILTDELKILAEFWAGGPGTVSPPLMFIWMWKEYMRILPSAIQQNSLQSVSCSTIMFSLQDLAVHLFEGARVIWRLKTTYMEARPIQEIRRIRNGQQITSWDGKLINGNQWVPYQMANFVTPPFADFPSGHSYFSKAFALTMTKWFGAGINNTSTFYDQLVLISPLFKTNQSNNYGNFKVSARTSLIQETVPALDTDLSYTTWDEMAGECAGSRITGGIHTPHANTKARDIAITIDTNINAVWDIKIVSTQGNRIIQGPINLKEIYPCYPPGYGPVSIEESTPASIIDQHSQLIPAAYRQYPYWYLAMILKYSLRTVIPAKPLTPVTPTVTPATAASTTTVKPVTPVVPVVPVAPVVPVVPSVPVVPVAPIAPVIPPPTITPKDAYKIHLNYLSIVPSDNVKSLIAKSAQFLESIITKTHGCRLAQVSLLYDMVVDIDIKSLAPGVLASARPTIINTTVTPPLPLRQAVIINSNALNEIILLAKVKFNNTVVEKLVPVLVHEMIHGLGIASLQSGSTVFGWDKFLDAEKIWYIGKNGNWETSEAIKAYREIVGTHIYRIPVENSFGQGTACSHWEEGIKDGFVTDPRYYDYGSGFVFHPALPEEIMTGVAGKSFFFTKLTAGALIDHGYNVNIDSPNIVPYPETLIQTI